MITFDVFFLTSWTLLQSRSLLQLVRSSKVVQSLQHYESQQPAEIWPCQLRHLELLNNKVSPFDLLRCSLKTFFHLIEVRLPYDHVYDHHSPMELSSKSRLSEERVRSNKLRKSLQSVTNILWLCYQSEHVMKLVATGYLTSKSLQMRRLKLQSQTVQRRLGSVATSFRWIFLGCTNWWSNFAFFSKCDLNSFLLSSSFVFSSSFDSLSKGLRSLAGEAGVSLSLLAVVEVVASGWGVGVGVGVSADMVSEWE